MAFNRWRGDSQPVAQVSTLTVAGTFAVGQTYTVTMNRKTVAYTSIATDASNTDVAIGLAAALNNSTLAEIKEAIYTQATTVVTATATTPGKPFTFSSSSGSGAGTLTLATPTASTGPNHYDEPKNWSLNAIPVNTNDVVIEKTSSSILYGIDQNAITLNSLVINSTFTGEIGLADYNSNYVEYRETYLKISATTVKIGEGDGGGSPRIQLDTGTNAAAVNVTRMGAPSAGGGFPALFYRGIHASNTFDISNGIAAIAFETGQVSTVPLIRIGFVNSPQSDVTLYVGSGATLTTVSMDGGVLKSSSSITTLNMLDGSVTMLGTAGVTTVNGQKGTLYYQSTATITTATVGTDFTLDFTRDLRPRTVTNMTVLKDGSVLDKFKTVTFTNPFSLDNCSLDEVTLDLGSNILIQRT